MAETLSPASGAGGLTQGEVADLYRRTGAQVLRRCRWILKDAAEAEDVMHEVYIRALRNGASLREAQSQLAWLYRAAERVCFDRLRARKRGAPAREDDVAQEPWWPGPAGQLEAQSVVQRFFHQLDPELMQLALLHFADGLSQEQIAAELGWSRKTVGKYLEKLRERAQKLAAAGARP